MKKKLGEILVASGVVSDADVEAALSDQSAGEPSRLGDLLVATGKISSIELARGLAEQYELPFVDLPLLPQAVLDLVPLELQRQYRFVPLRSDGTELFIGMADLSNMEVLAILEQQWTKVHVHVAGGDEIDALHNTLSGIFQIPGPELPNVAPSISPMSATEEDLFGSFELEPDLMRPIPSPVPVIAPVHAVDGPRPSPSLHASAPPRAEDLFGDLNLESARTGIAAKLPDEEPQPPSPPPPAPLEAPGVTVESELPPPEEPMLPFDTEGEAEAEPVPGWSEGSGPVLMGVREGTGPLLDLIMESGGTGPIIDTPFFRDAQVGDLVQPVSDLPFSTPSSLAALAIPPPPSTTLAVVPAMTAPEPSSPVDQLPDWLKTDAADAVPSTGHAQSPGAWTGALDHLAPSKLVVGLTRALLARGLISEDEILAALGQKK